MALRNFTNRSCTFLIPPARNTLTINRANRVRTQIGQTSAMNTLKIGSKRVRKHNQVNLTNNRLNRTMSNNITIQRRRTVRTRNQVIKINIRTNISNRPITILLRFNRPRNRLNRHLIQLLRRIPFSTRITRRHRNRTRFLTNNALNKIHKANARILTRRHQQRRRQNMTLSIHTLSQIRTIKSPSAIDIL